MTSNWIVLEQVILSGQMDDAAVHALMADDPDFAAWLKSRARARQRS